MQFPRIVLAACVSLVGCLSAAGQTQPNDLFENRIAISTAEFSIFGDNTGATAEPGEPWLDSGGARGSVWYEWRCPVTGTARLYVGRRYQDSDYSNPPILLVYTGTSVSALTDVPEVRSNESGSSFIVHCHVEAGRVYQLRVDMTTIGVGHPFHLYGSVIGSPANDMFADRIRLEGRHARFTGNVLSATPEPGDPGDQSLWWTWTAPASGRLVWTMYNSVYTSGIWSNWRTGWYSGDSLATLVPVTQLESGLELRQFDVLAGQTYQLLVDGHTATSVIGDIYLFDKPPNDDFANRTVLSGSQVTFSGTTIGASVETFREPRHQIYLPAESTVWWSWTAPQSGTVMVRTLDQTFNAGFAIYTGSGLDSMNLVKSKWNAYGAPLEVMFEATAGTDYSICAVGANNTIGEFVAELSYPTRPVNDDLRNATVIEGFEATVSQSLFGATRQAADSGFTSAPRNGTSVWWKWTAPADGPVVFSTEGSDFDTVLGVGASYYPNTEPSEDEPINRADENDDDPGGGSHSRVEFTAVAGKTYYIMVDGFINFCGRAVLHMHFGQPVPVITTDLPDGLTMRLGEPYTLSIGVSGPGPFHCVWEGPEGIIPGESSTTLTIPTVQINHRGVYHVDVYTPGGSVRSRSPWVEIEEPVRRARLRMANLSTRGRTGTGDDVLIPGFVVSGEGSASILVRAIGPTLGTLWGLPGALPDPVLSLHSGGGRLLENDDWGTAIGAREAFGRTGAFALPEGSADAALLAEMPAGSYTAICADKQGQPGVALVEIYNDTPEGSGPELINISTRGYVGEGSEVLIPGFVIEGPGTVRLLIRAVGPTLGDEPFRLAGVLSDPMLQVYRMSDDGRGSTLVARNRQWSRSPYLAMQISQTAESIGAFPLPGESNDAALILDLPAGVYTAHASGEWGYSGLALVEIYIVP